MLHQHDPVLTWENIVRQTHITFLQNQILYYQVNPTLPTLS